MHLIYRNTCRVCGSPELTPVIDLGEQHLQGSFVKPGKEMPPLRKIPMTLVRCDPSKDENACGLLQMKHSVPPDILYSAYWYRSGTNATMRNHLKSIVNDAQDIVKKKKAIVLDIGCNDGTLLNYYSDGFQKYGIDPSDVAQEIGNDIRVIQDIFPSKELITEFPNIKFDIITSIAMFYDLEDPIGFTKSIKNILKNDGIWVFEMSYMPTMLEKKSYDTICHEHLEYYSLAVIEYILSHADMKIFNVSLNNINGGSIRCYATHNDNFKYKYNDFIDNVKKLRQNEFDIELDSDKPYKNFQDEINKHKKDLTELLNKLNAEGKKIHIYGASTKGNTILQWCGINNNIIEAAAERNPDKFGAHTLGTNIPIVSEEDSRLMNPDYYLILPWHFKEEFIQRENEMLKKGIGLIFPLPEIEIYKL